MIEEPPLLTVHEHRPTPSPEQVAALGNYPTGFVVDALGGSGALHGNIHAMAPGALPSTLCGPVLACDCGPRDLLAVLAGIAEARPGDVLVAATGNWSDSAVVGDRVLGMARNAGVAGLVTDGKLRDLAGIIDVGLPVFATGLSPNSPFAKGPGVVGASVVVGGVTINSGDVVVADTDGVVIVPFDQIDAVLESLLLVAELEKELDAKVANGQAVPDDIIELMASDSVRRI